MKIVSFIPKKDFSPKQQKRLSSLGEVVFLESPYEHPMEELKKIAVEADFIALDPDNFGGFEKSREKVTQLIQATPTLKGIALSTTSFGWVDLELCKTRNIPVCNVPGYSRESVAEHVLAMLLGLAKQIFITDRRTQKGAYKISKGFELKGKTLGIIGLGNIGSRVAELGHAVGMKVIAYNRNPKSQPNVEMKALNEVLKTADALSLHVTHEDKNERMLGKAEISKMKPGIIIVNVTDRNLFDENALAEAMVSNRVAGYAYEAEDLKNAPLKDVETAIAFKGFGWYTTEALNNLYEIIVDNIEAFTKGKPQNVVN